VIDRKTERMQPMITGTMNVTLEGVSIKPPGPPDTYIGTARNFLVGVLELANTPNCAFALAFLAAQAAECGLKAYLSRSGNDIRLKQNPIRHDLSALWTLAAHEGLGVAATPPNWLSNLSQLHGAPYYLRCSIGVHGVVLPATEPMVSELSALIENISGRLY